MRIRSIVTLLAVVGLCSCVVAQEEQEQPPIVTGRSIIAVDTGNGPVVLEAGPVNGAAFLGGEGLGNVLSAVRSSFGGSDSSRWLNNPHVQKELNLLDDQMEKIRKLRERSSQKSRDMFSTMRNVAAGKRGEFLSEARKALAAETEKELKSILLPHQSKRLSEISLQMAMKNSVSRGLSGDKVADALGITKEQKEELRKKQLETQRELQEKIAELREKAKQDLLSVLTKKQQQQLEEMLGKKFEMESMIPSGLRSGGRFNLPQGLIPNGATIRRTIKK